MEQMKQMMNSESESGLQEQLKYDAADALELLEISQAEFLEHIEEDDFFLAYGNPVIIDGDGGSKAMVIAWPLEERILRMTGEGDTADEIIRIAAEI